MYIGRSMRGSQGSATGFESHYGMLNEGNLPWAKVVDVVPLEALSGHGAPDPDLTQFRDYHHYHYHHNYHHYHHRHHHHHHRHHHHHIIPTWGMILYIIPQLKKKPECSVPGSDRRIGSIVRQPMCRIGAADRHTSTGYRKYKASDRQSTHPAMILWALGDPRSPSHLD